MEVNHASALRILPCVDSDEMADARRRELSISRDLAAELGQSAVRAIAEGWYWSHSGRRIEWRDQVNAARAAKRSIPPDATLPQPRPPEFSETRVQVTNETTLGAAHSLMNRGRRPLALNFANGIHPGGGFLHGARAQEEVLCRSSALYATLAGDPMYTAHKQRPAPDSSDWVIYSPDVPVFRTDDGRALDHPWFLNFLTCAAPFAPVIGQPASANLLKARIHRVLTVARAHAYDVLVLGAWGCGAFGNDPARTAADFRRALETDFSGAFAEIVFAISDWSQERRILGPFRDAFAE